MWSGLVDIAQNQAGTSQTTEDVGGGELALQLHLPNTAQPRFTTCLAGTYCLLGDESNIRASCPQPKQK